MEKRNKNILTWFIIFCKCVCVCVWNTSIHGVHVDVRGQQYVIVHHVGPRNGTQIMSIVGKFLYTLRHSISSILSFNNWLVREVLQFVLEYLLKKSLWLSLYIPFIYPRVSSHLFMNNKISHLKLEEEYGMVPHPLIRCTQKLLRKNTNVVVKSDTFKCYVPNVSVTKEK